MVRLRTGASGLEPTLGLWPACRVRAGRGGRRKGCSETGCCSGGWKSRRRNSQFAAGVMSGRRPGDPATGTPGSKHPCVKRGGPFGGRMTPAGLALYNCCQDRGGRAAEEVKIPEESARCRVKAAEPDAGRCMHGLGRTGRKERGEAGAQGPSAACSWSGKSWQEPRPGRQCGGGSVPGLTATGQPATVCSAKAGTVAPCGRLPPGVSWGVGQLRPPAWVSATACRRSSPRASTPGPGRAGHGRFRFPSSGPLGGSRRSVAYVVVVGY